MPGTDLPAALEARPKWPVLLAFLAIIFGAATLKEGGSVLFTEAGRRSAGHYVPFVLWFNFAAGFAYLAAGAGLLRLHRWAQRLSAVIAASNLVVLVLLLAWVAGGGAYERRTLLAMTARAAFWGMIAVLVAGREPLSGRRASAAPRRR